jgi:hypothetical protein
MRSATVAGGRSLAFLRGASGSVALPRENGRKFQNSKRGDAAMPDGAAIFETSGAWEDFSTPSRDLRLLIAIDVVLRFPDRVARRPERYAMPRGQKRG